MRHAPAIAATIVFFGCGGPEAEPPPQPQLERDPPSPVQPVGGGDRAGTGVTQEIAPRRSLDPAARRRLRAAVRDGRAAFRAENYREADARFQEALTIDDKSSRLRCEAGFVAFRAGELERAERDIHLALAAMPETHRAPEPVRRPLAMCLYNAGLVYQARGHRERARNAWQRSLRLRPNRTVEARLAALGAPTTEAAEGAALALDSSASYESIANQIRDQWCEEGGDGFTREMLSSCRQISTELSALAGAARDIDARLLTMRVRVDGEDRRAVLIVRRGESTNAYELAQIYSPGSMGMSAEFNISHSSFEELQPGGASEIRLQIREGDNDEDMGICERYGSTREATVLCGADDGTIRCARITTLSDSYFMRDECEEVDQPAVEEHEGYSLSLTFEAGEVIISEPTGSDPPEGIAGRRSLQELLRSEELTVLPL